MRALERADRLGVATVERAATWAVRSFLSTKPRVTSSPPKSSSWRVVRALVGNRERGRVVVVEGAVQQHHDVGDRRGDGDLRLRLEPGLEIAQRARGSRAA